jgi:membrane fusion protein (multidrug efflux system)
MTSNTMTEHLGAVPLPAPRAPAQRKRQLLAAALVVAGLAVLGYGTHWWRTGRFLESTDDAYIGGDVTVMAAKVPGYIAEVAVTDNQAVHAGELLVKIDPRDYQAALAKAEGAVAAAQATLANLDATEQLQQAVIAQARAGVSATRADTVRAQQDQVRYLDLSNKSAVSLQSAQKADAEYKQALAYGQKADATVSAAQRQLAVIATQKQQARAALAQVSAERDQARLNLGYTELRAPIDGTIGNRRARAGAYAAAGSQLLAVVPAHGLWVDANFKEDQLARIEPGMRATVHADVLPGRVFHGTVGSLAPATGAQFSILPPENATGNFTKIVQRVPVRILLDAQDGTLGVLRPGLSAVAEIDTRAAGTGARP